MSKSILVIDTPSNCKKCRLREYDRENFIVCMHKWTGDERPDWCPLRPLPQKNKYDVEKYATVDYENDVTLGHYLNKGWNDCLDAITGETE